MENDVRQIIAEEWQHIVEVRHQIHENPELGFDEMKTTALVKTELEKNGIDIVSLEMETGVLAVVKGTSEWKGTGIPPVIGIRADMDALPIEETTNQPYSSKTPGVMHACGHDGHTANLLGTAIVLQRLRERFAGTVKFFFQPAEETLYGAQKMLACSILENPAVDKVIALHAAIDLPIGTIGVYPGPFMASADVFKVKMIGVGTHAAAPFRGSDALLAAAQAALNLQIIISREIDANDRAVLSVCQIHGGDAFNIIPGQVELAGSVRCHDQVTRERIAERIKSICEGVAQSYRCEAKVEHIWGLPATINDPAVTEEIAQAAVEAIGGDNVVRLEAPMMGSEDFSLFARRVPSAIFRLGVIGEAKMSLHNPNFDFADDALLTGMAVFVQYVLNQTAPKLC